LDARVDPFLVGLVAGGVGDDVIDGLLERPAVGAGPVVEVGAGGAQECGELDGWLERAAVVAEGVAVLEVEAGAVGSETLGDEAFDTGDGVFGQGGLVEDAANDALQVLASNFPDYDAFDDEGNLVLAEQILNRDRSWTNIMTMGLLDRPDVPPPIRLERGPQ